MAMHDQKRLGVAKQCEVASSRKEQRVLWIENQTVGGNEMGKPWTDERRQRQRDVINEHKPWLKSTGPRTDVGKANVRRNAYSGGLWFTLRVLSVQTTKVIRDMKAAGMWPPR